MNVELVLLMIKSILAQYKDSGMCQSIDGKNERKADRYMLQQQTAHMNILRNFTVICRQPCNKPNHMK